MKIKAAVTIQQIGEMLRLNCNPPLPPPFLPGLFKNRRDDRDEEWDFDTLPHGSIVHVHPRLLVKAKKKCNISMYS